MGNLPEPVEPIPAGNWTYEGVHHEQDIGTKRPGFPETAQQYSPVSMAPRELCRRELSWRVASEYKLDRL